MFANRSSKIVVILLLLAIVFLSTSFSTHAANIRTVKSSYGNIEFVRSEQPTIPSADRSYDAIEFARYKPPSRGAANSCTGDGCIYPLPNGIFVH